MDKHHHKPELGTEDSDDNAEESTLKKLLYKEIRFISLSAIVALLGGGNFIKESHDANNSSNNHILAQQRFNALESQQHQDEIDIAVLKSEVQELQAKKH